MINLYTVHDTVSDTFINPFAMKTDRDAIEGFRVVANDEKTNYNKFPADFVLCRIGTFDERTGKINSDELKTLISAHALIKKEK